MGRLRMAAALALGLSSTAQAGVEVTATGDRVDVIASQAPVSEVLDGLARQTRMKVVYEGPAPRTPVTLELRGRTPAEAVLGVLEGLGLNYALVLDASGTKVETLMIVGAGTGTRTASAASVRPPRGGRKDAPHASPDTPMVESEEPPPEVEAGVANVPQDVAKAEEGAKGPPAPIGPLNPTGALPVLSPFAPGPLPLPLPLPTPSPSPNAPSSN